MWDMRKLKHDCVTKKIAVHLMNVPKSQSHLPVKYFSTSVKWTGQTSRSIKFQLLSFNCRNNKTSWASFKSF